MPSFACQLVRVLGGMKLTDLVASSAIALVDTGGLLRVVIRTSSRGKRNPDLVFDIAAMARAVVYLDG